MLASDRGTCRRVHVSMRGWRVLTEAAPPSVDLSMSRMLTWHDIFLRLPWPCGTSGTPWVWQVPQFSDPLQGPAYHISKAKDAASGQRWDRFKAFLEAVPVRTTLHSDAYRDINDSWEMDERGFIAEDEEAMCGLQGDQRFWAIHSLSFGVEGGNGALVAVDPVPGFNGITDYYWHGQSSLGTLGHPLHLPHILHDELVGGTRVTRSHGNAAMQQTLLRTRADAAAL